MERRISFVVGYDHTAHPEDCGGGGHGRHGMEMIFTLIGPAGAVSWTANMRQWYPGNIDHGHVGPNGGFFSAVPSSHRIDDGSGVAVDYHSREQQYEGQWCRDACRLLNGTCYSDVSYLHAGEILEEFINHGPMAVWAALAKAYEHNLNSTQSDRRDDA
jgi:hypothetical protein